MASIWKHLEPTWSTLGVHLDSRMHLEFSRRVPKASRGPKSSQNARVGTILEALKGGNNFGGPRDFGRIRSTLAEH